MKRMERIVPLLLIAAFAVFFTPACGSPPPAPAPVKEEPKPEPPPKEEPKPVEEVFAEVHQKYYNGLILDGATSYTVVKHDTLTKIAKKVWNKEYEPYYFPVFILASQETISDPDLIEPEMVLTVPDLKANLDDSEARANIKAFLKEIADVYAKTTRRHRNEMVKYLTALSDSL